MSPTRRPLPVCVPVERVATRCLAPESASPEALDVEDDDDLEANSFAGRGGCGGATASGSRVTALLKPSGFELLDAEPVATGSRRSAGSCL
mmetsp:Transcript_126159/g.315350  ORF Transcript_126159/g.315350 Transcript_126159/m.315350 type:complete len:91 (+) Transcript_126159:448-720(+)